MRAVDAAARAAATREAELSWNEFRGLFERSGNAFRASPFGTFRNAVYQSGGFKIYLTFELNHRSTVAIKWLVATAIVGATGSDRPAKII